MKDSVIRLVGAGMLAIALVGCGGSPTDQAPVEAEQKSDYHVIKVEGVSFEVKKEIELADEVSHSRWATSYEIGDSRGGTTDWYAMINVSNDEYDLSGTYDSVTDADGIRIYQETRVIEGGTMPPIKALSFNYGGRGYEIMFMDLGGDVDAAITHILETIHFD